jgi:hypothetical protein
MESLANVVTLAAKVGKDKAVHVKTAVLEEAVQSVVSFNSAVNVGSSDAVHSMTMKKEQAERKTQLAQIQATKLDQRMAFLTEQILVEKRRKADAGGVYADVLQKRLLGKRLAVLDADYAGVRLRRDAELGRIHALKRSIDTFRGEIVRQKKVFVTVKGGIEEHQARLADTLELCNDAQEDLEGIQQEHEDLKKVNDTEQAEFEKEMDEVQGIIDSIRDGTFESPEFPKAADEDGPGSGDLTEEQEKELRDRILELDSLMRSVEADIRGLYEQTSQLQEIFQLMLRRGGLETLDDLIDMFSGEESYKYEQYGYIQRVSKEGKRLESHLGELNGSIREKRASIRSRDKVLEEKKKMCSKEVERVSKTVDHTESELEHRRDMTKSLASLALRCYRVAGGTDIAVLDIEKLVTTPPPPTAATVAPGLPPEMAEKRLAEAMTVYEETKDEFSITDASLKRLLSATEERTAEVTSIFAGLLESQPTASKMLRELSRQVHGKRGSDSDSDEGDLPIVVQPRDVPKMVRKFRNGPIGSDQTSLFGEESLPRLGLPLAKPHGFGLLSAPSVDEVNMDEDEEVCIPKETHPDETHLSGESFHDEEEGGDDEAERVGIRGLVHTSMKNAMTLKPYQRSELLQLQQGSLFQHPMSSRAHSARGLLRPPSSSNGSLSGHFNRPRASSKVHLGTRTLPKPISTGSLRISTPASKSPLK